MTYGRQSRAGSFVVAVTFLGLPLWWALGVSAFVWPLLVLPLLFSLLLNRRARIPRGFGLWLLFCVWMLLSAVQIESADRLLAFVYRGSLYLAATILFLYVFNAPRSALPTRTVVNVMVALWAVLVVGGYLGLLFPAFEARAVAASLMPNELRRVEFVRDVLDLGFADMSDLFGRSIPRPRTFFAYTNAWGSTFALLLPFVFLRLFTLTKRRKKLALQALLALSVVPFVLSLNRGAWLSVVAGLATASLYFAAKRNTQAITGVVALSAVAAVALVATPGSELIGDRFEAGQSNEGRQSLAQEAVARTGESPLFGHGTPLPSEEAGAEAPSVGTHGQLYLVLFSHGVPALALFVGWFLHGATRPLRGNQHVQVWMRVAVVVFLVQGLFYSLLPLQLLVVMVACALLYRELAPPAFNAPARRGRRRTTRQRPSRTPHRRPTPPPARVLARRPP